MSMVQHLFIPLIWAAAVTKMVKALLWMVIVMPMLLAELIPLTFPQRLPSMGTLQGELLMLLSPR